MTPEEAEFYPTPAWCVHRILEALVLPEGHWFDPCVGEGAIPDAVYLPGIRWTTVDIRDTGYADHVEDYLRAGWPRADVCIMNPPFSKALQFAATAIEHCGVVVMLQRLNWLQAPERAPWLRDHPPALYVLPERPSFTGKGTDGGGYAWYAWGPAVPRGVHILNSTPDADRKRDEARVAANRYRGPEQLGLLEA